jgi:putative ABC transport system permease protein
MRETIDTLRQDLRYGWRILIRSPGLTAVMILTLALGIGASTAIFTVVNAALLRGLPYAQPESLVHLWETRPRQQFPQREASYPDFLDWRQCKAFSGLAAYAGGGSLTLLGYGAPERLQAGRVTANFFTVLGVEPALGRHFRAGEDEPGAGPVALLSHGLWQRRFGADPSIIGRTINLSGTAFTVIGVLPAGFHFAPRGAAEIWAPWRPGEQQLSRRFMHWVNVIARLKPGVSLEEAEAAMQLIAGRIAREHAESHAGTGIRLRTLHAQIVGPVRPVLLLLLAAVLCALLIACSNVAGLLIARALARGHEVAIRAALGAGRWRLVRQMLTESALLAALGGMAGLIVAQWGIDALVAAIPESRLEHMPYLRDLRIDGRALLFTAGVTIATCLLAGLAPALMASRVNLNGMLKEGGRTSSGGTRAQLRRGLIVAEIALSLVLLVGAGLLVQSLARLTSVDPGFNPVGLLALQFSAPAAKYDDARRAGAFHEQLLARLAALPGVKGAASIDPLPFAGGNTISFHVAGEAAPLPGEEIESHIREVSAGYFRVMEVPLKRGREFTDRDRLDSPRVLIINQTLAKRAFPSRDPIGLRLVFEIDDATPYEIVGVVGDEQVNALDARITPVIYTPALQFPAPFGGLVVRAAPGANPTQLGSAVRTAALELEPELAIYNVKTIEETVAELPSIFLRRYPALLIGLFAVVALLLSVIGIYGVVSYAVSRQRREISIRLALGATPGDILRQVLGQGLALVAAGVAVGTLGSMASAQLISSLLYGVSPTDPLTYGAVALALASVTLGACYLPARRAARTDPIVALRGE